jgi:hypothetical protein
VRGGWPDGRHRQSSTAIQLALVDCNSRIRSRAEFAQMRDSSRGRDYRALYQGPTLVGPQAAEKELGFSPCDCYQISCYSPLVPSSWNDQSAAAAK